MLSIVSTTTSCVSTSAFTSLVHHFCHLLHKICIYFISSVSSSVGLKNWKISNHSNYGLYKTSAHAFRTRIRFKQYDVILTREQSVITKTMCLFAGENMRAQYNVLSYRIDLYFYDYKLAIETDENGYIDRITDYEIKRQKTIEQELGCKFLRIDTDEEDFNLFRSISEIFRHIKQSTKKNLINKISARFLGFEFKSDNMIKSKAMKFITQL